MRIGLLGASRIAPNAVIAPARSTAGVTVTAVAARDMKRAEEFAHRNGISCATGDYTELVERDDVDLVYCALPPSVRHDICLRAIAAGKMLLVEKPFAANARAAQDLSEAARRGGVHALEALHYRFHSMFSTVLDIVREGKLGELTHASGCFDAPVPRVGGEYRWESITDGGATMDLGCYVIHAMRTIFGSEPRVLDVHSDIVGGVDAATKATLSFGGRDADMRCSMRANIHHAIELHGTRGSLRFDSFVAPQGGGRLVLETRAGVEEWLPTGPTSYEAQLAHCRDVFHGATVPLTGGADAVANLVVIDTCKLAAGLSVEDSDVSAMPVMLANGERR